MKDWKTVRLNEIAESVDYGVTASATDHPIGPKFLRITDIQNGTVNWDSVPWCECDTCSTVDSRLNPGDIVFARTGATTGKSFLIQECPKDAIFASYLIRVRVGSLAEPRYISHFFQTPNYWAQITKSARGVAQPGVNATVLKELKIPVPPLEEQKRIADILDRAEALRAKRREALAQLDELTQSIFIEMFGDPVTNPKEWKTIECANICERITVGIVVKPASYYVSSGVPALRSLNIKPGYISLKDLVYFSENDNNTKLAKTKLKAGDLVIVRTGQPGTSAVVPADLDGVNAIDLLIATPKPNIVDPEFLSQFFNSSGGRSIVLTAQRGQIQKHLNVGSLNESCIPLPPIELQQEFSCCIAALEKLKTKQKTSLAELDELFASLQYRAFRGEL